MFTEWETVTMFFLKLSNSFGSNSPLAGWEKTSNTLCWSNSLKECVMFLLVLSMSWLSCFDVSGGLLSLQVIVAVLPVESRLTWRALLPHRQTVHPFAIPAYSCIQDYRGLTDLSSIRAKPGYTPDQFIAEPQKKTNQGKQFTLHDCFWTVEGIQRIQRECRQRWGEHANSTKKGFSPFLCEKATLLWGEGADHHCLPRQTI